jgi:nucleotide-binding universal stress UspA family protein
LFSKILIGLDGSSYANAALAYASDIAKKYESKLTIIHVIVSHVFAYEGVIIAEPDARLREEGKRILSEGEKLAFSLGVSVDTRLVAGHPADKMSEVANKEGYDLVVVGNRGLSGVKAFLLGSVSDRVSRYAKCPVLIVKSE